MRQRYFNGWLDRAHLRLIDNEQHVARRLSLNLCVDPFVFVGRC